MRANKNLTPVCIIYSDGKRLDVEHEGALRSITITDCLNNISTFSVIFDTAEVKIKEKGLISSGSKLSIHLGYKDDVEEVFSGEVLSFRGMLTETGAEQLEVGGCNVLYRLNHATRFRSFEGKAPSEVLNKLIGTYSLKADVDSFGSAKPFRSEENMTDYEYLMKQAKAYGKQVYASGSTIHVKNEISVRTDEVIYEWGKSLMSFEAAEDVSGLVTGVDYAGWDYQNENFFVGSAGLGGMPVRVGGSKFWNEVNSGSGGNLVDSRVNLNSKDSGESGQLALGMLQNNSYNFMTAHGKGEGNYKLRPGMRVTVKMVGDSYEGEYIAEVVIHRFDYHTGYIAEFDLKRNMQV